MKESIAQLRNQADFIIISLHAGIEYTGQPNQFQKDFAHNAIDVGADLVIGHHPHWVQSAEIYKDKYIFYSLGNFIFDQMWSEPTREGLVVKFIFNKQGIKSIELKPILIEDYSQPRFLEGERAKRIIERLKLPAE
jgi:poly-gamma-glutamate synthesis protein (capsule biosynthesis protein)